MNIVELLKDKQMNEPTPQQPPAPTEHGQIVINYNFAAPGPIYRFTNAKKGRKVYDAMVKAWKARGEWTYLPNKKSVPKFFDIVADMYDGSVDLDMIASISFVEWPKRDKCIARG